jgi:hypothetical protein
MSPVSAFFIRGGINFAVGQVVDDDVKAQRLGRDGGTGQSRLLSSARTMLSSKSCWDTMLLKAMPPHHKFVGKEPAFASGKEGETGLIRRR